jgi:uncharacterized protein (DUF2236 family)
MGGYFQRESLLRQVYGERVVGFFYGQRALCVGAANPLTYLATVIHSKGRRKPFERLAHTAQVFETVIFANRTEADRVLAIVNEAHRCVEGVLPVDAGLYPVGTHYYAFDPELMLGVIAAIADSALYFFELFVRPLSMGEKDAFWCDQLDLAGLFGMSRESAPASYAEFRAWWQERLESSDLYLTAEARKTGYGVAFEVPMPAYTPRAVRELHNVIVLGSLPPRIRDLYGLAYTTEDQTRHQRAVVAVRALRRCSPRGLAWGSSRVFYRWIAAEERRRLKHGGSTPSLLSPVRERSDPHGG